MESSEAQLRATQEREDRDRGIVKDPDRYVRRRGVLYSRAEMSSIYDVLKPGPTDRVVDLGCGVGRISLDLAKQVESVIGFDFSLESVSILRRRIPTAPAVRVTAAVADMRQVPLPDQCCTRVVSCQVVQHIPSAAWRLQALQEAFRILKPGGRVALTVYQWGSMVRDRKESDFGGRSYRMAFTAEEVKELLIGAGFSDVQVRGVIHLPHRLMRHLPGFLWPLERQLSRSGRLLGRATYLLGCGVKA